MTPLLTKYAEKIDQMYDQVYAEWSLTEEVTALLSQMVEELLGSDEDFPTHDEVMEVVKLNEDNVTENEIMGFMLNDILNRNAFRAELRQKAGLTPERK